MFVQYNPNPLGKMTDDCVIRAVSRIMDEPWEKAYTSLCLQGLEMCDLPNNNAVWGEYLLQNGFVRESIENSCPNCYTVEDFCKDNPIGVYVIGTGTHAIAVIDGNFYDSYYSGNRVPLYAYRKE